MRLTDRRDGHVVAEYVGFSADHGVGYLHDMSAQCPWESTLECAGPERRCADGNNRWQALRFFLGEVVEVR